MLTPPGQYDQPTSQQVALTYFQAKPNIQVFGSFGDQMTAGAMTAFKQLGITPGQGPPGDRLGRNQSRPSPPSRPARCSARSRCTRATESYIAHQGPGRRRSPGKKIPTHDQRHRQESPADHHGGDPEDGQGLQAGLVAHGRPRRQSRAVKRGIRGTRRTRSSRMSASEVATIRLVSIGKRYAGTSALDDVSLEIKAGTVHALVGANGAGQVDSRQGHRGRRPSRRRRDVRRRARGEVRDAARRARRRDRDDRPGARARPAMSVMENVFLGIEPRRAGLIQPAADAQAVRRARRAQRLRARRRRQRRVAAHRRPAEGRDPARRQQRRQGSSSWTSRPRR